MRLLKIKRQPLGYAWDFLKHNHKAWISSYHLVSHPVNVIAIIKSICEFIQYSTWCKFHIKSVHEFIHGTNSNRAVLSKHIELKKQSNNQVWLIYIILYSPSCNLIELFVMKVLFLKWFMQFWRMQMFILTIITCHDIWCSIYIQDLQFFL